MNPTIEKGIRLLIIGSFFFHWAESFAVSELNYSSEYSNKVLPFMSTAQEFSFQSADGKYSLSAVKFIHSHEPQKGAILVLPGRTEPWLKYGEVFYDLYQQGYDIYSYDHRGQGLNEHLSSLNSQIGHILNFTDYVLDMEKFVHEILTRESSSQDNHSNYEKSSKLFLLAHSMGGAIAAEFLIRNEGVFQSAVLSAPMFQINTKPYPEFVAHALAYSIVSAKQGHKYAPGQVDYDPKTPFEENITTKSRARYKMGNDIFEKYPETLIGGPSSRWVLEGIRATTFIKRNFKRVKTPTLLLQAMSDQIVKLNGQTAACASTSSCQLIQFSNSEHEILMERDVIRDEAMSRIVSFFR